ncbi:MULTISPECIES: hypothetical protein [Coriobacteriales]|uniref:Uncharacterized protein n=1 Tax=Granulimonas faecalis TaxID=2894155 RepID=A0AAV5B380_9ACTN|nr:MULTISPECIES: hypothetical protein [Atopobiaceae]MBF0599025.1 hypothetical protein [Atopobiaceae bacterium FL090493]GJM55113.1 hypothetical protein ATOP_07680 [Granulimonas faecalis]
MTRSMRITLACVVAVVLYIVLSIAFDAVPSGLPKFGLIASRIGTAVAVAVAIGRDREGRRE